jgi:hypothetical protein
MKIKTIHIKARQDNHSHPVFLTTLAYTHNIPEHRTLLAPFVRKVSRKVRNSSFGFCFSSYQSFECSIIIKD